MRLGRMTSTHGLLISLGLVLTLALSGCGGAGTKYNEFLPKRMVILGDEIVYIGCADTTQNGVAVCAGIDADDRFSLNNTPANANVANADNTQKLTRQINNWVLQLAALYNLKVSDIVEPTYIKSGVAGDTAAMRRRNSRDRAELADIQAQMDYLPKYTNGDLLVIAGGAHDILNTLLNSPVSVTLSGPLAQVSKRSNKTYADELRESSGTATLTVAQAYQVMMKAQGYQDLAQTMQGLGHRNIFLTPVYDFSNSPDLRSFCSGCSKENLQAAIRLFNSALKLDPTNRFSASPGEPRVLLATGITATDSQYVNITDFVTIPGSGVFNFDISASVCGISSRLANPVTLNQCFWSGIYTTTTVAGISYDPTNPANDSFTTNQAFLVASGNRPAGGFIYARDFYLTPLVQQRIGSIFYTFMRGFQGW